ncbi:hypothetical protein AC579_8411 [Pseudocercospora musae]|uniref:NADP-dependent oxidoreductase domain-containing protein n=1 Tax=Pseudocercospora musae TaxID=113226 RepID=A0A139IHU1_9PEZI|nr:hypothetical protein AC579_8411 [Pseudocercospora musae]
MLQRTVVPKTVTASQVAYQDSIMSPMAIEPAGDPEHGAFDRNDNADAVVRSIHETHVTYKRLGNTGLRVSVPILGCMSLGDKHWVPWSLEEDKALPLLKGAFDHGLNTWDTANVYSNGKSEEIIGKAIKTYQLPRHKLILLSKCGGYVGEAPNVKGDRYENAISRSKDYVNQGGLSRSAIFEQVEASLRRLDTKYLDVLQIHRFDPSTPIEETMKALHDLVSIGKVRYIGACSMYTYQFAQMQFVAEKNGWTKFVSMQNHYSLLYREEERDMINFCNETGVGLIPWAPLASGMLTRPATAKVPEGDRAIIKRVQEVAERRGWRMSYVALSWINKRVSAPVIDFDRIDRIAEALATKDKELTAEEEKYIEELYKAKDVEGIPSHR